MGNNSFRVYPRGFLGADVEIHYERSPNRFAEQIRSHYYHAPNGNRDGTSIQCNPHVEDVYSTYVRNDFRTCQLEFRKKVIKTAFDAFSVPRFDVWVLAQYQNPAAGSLHSDFIVDTLNYLQTGERKMCLENWMSLLLITDQGNTIGDIPDEVRQFFSLNELPNNRTTPNTQMVDIIARWFQHENGMDDLIGTLHILFGNI